MSDLSGPRIPRSSSCSALPTPNLLRVARPPPGRLGHLSDDHRGEPSQVGPRELGIDPRVSAAAVAEVFDHRRYGARSAQTLEQGLRHLTPPQVRREGYTRDAGL